MPVLLITNTRRISRHCVRRCSSSAHIVCVSIRTSVSSLPITSRGILIKSPVVLRCVLVVLIISGIYPAALGNNVINFVVRACGKNHFITTSTLEAKIILKFYIAQQVLLLMAMRTTSWFHLSPAHHFIYCTDPSVRVTSSTTSADKSISISERRIPTFRGASIPNRTRLPSILRIRTVMSFRMTIDSSTFRLKTSIRCSPLLGGNEGIPSARSDKRYSKAWGESSHKIPLKYPHLRIRLSVKDCLRMSC